MNINKLGLYLNEEQATPSEYPEHPNTVLIKNDYYKKGLTEHMVWKHNYNHTSDLFKDLKGHRILTIVKTPQGDILRRKKDDKEYQINNKADISELNSGRAMEFHIVADAETDVAWIDLDPREDFDFEQVKNITTDLVPILTKVSESDDILTKYSSGRGFHLISWMKEKRNVDDLRKELIEELKKYSKGNPKLTTSFAQNRDMMRLDVSTLHESGSIRAAWSLNSKTGLISLPLSPNEIEIFNKKMAVINLPKELIFYPFKEDPNSTSGQMRWRQRDPDSFLQDSMLTWKYWGDVTEEGLSFIVGKLKQPYDEMAVQALRFSRDKWNSNTASKWWEENYWKFDKMPNLW